MMKFSNFRNKLNELVLFHSDQKYVTYMLHIRKIAKAEMKVKHVSYFLREGVRMNNFLVLSAP